MDSYASAFFLLMGIGLLVSRLFSGYIVDKGYLVILVCMADLVALGAALLLARTTSPVLFLGCGGCWVYPWGLSCPAIRQYLYIWRTRQSGELPMQCTLSGWIAAYVFPS